MSKAEAAGLVKEIRLAWSRPQGLIIRETARYVDVEGAIRSGKTTVGVWKAITLCLDYPGITGLLCRWTGDSLDAQLKPRFWELCPPEVLAAHPWNAKEEYVGFANGSRLYIRALKSSDETARFSKVAGLTLAFILADQPEELPWDMYLYLKGRLSQPGYPQQLILLPNPPDPDHWICKEFPDEGPQKPDHALIRLSTYDNRQHLGEQYIQSLEAAYPVGHPLRRRLLEGQRGATQRGVAVYGKIFKPGLHVKRVTAIPGVAILEAWDFSFSHPAVSWHQITPWGAWRTLGEWLGEDQYLEHAVPQVLQRRAVLLNGATSPVWVTCDPTGASPTSHGSERTAVRILQEHGISPTVLARANQPAVRVYAVEQIARLLLRLTPEGAAYEIDPSCANLIDGFQAGYVYQEKLLRGRRVPLKDGYYDHLQNTLEYAVLAFLVPELGAAGAVMPLPEESDEDEREIKQTRPTGRAGY